MTRENDKSADVSRAICKEVSRCSSDHTSIRRERFVGREDAWKSSAHVILFSSVFLNFFTILQFFTISYTVRTCAFNEQPQQLSVRYRYYGSRVTRTFENDGFRTKNDRDSKSLGLAKNKNIFRGHDTVGRLTVSAFRALSTVYNTRESRKTYDKKGRGAQSQRSNTAHFRE